MSSIKHIVLHHSAIMASSDTSEQFFQINEYHKNLWNFRSSLGYYGGYHYLIERDGLVERYRVETERAAHCYVPGFDYNGNSIGVCLAGDLTQESPTVQQIRALTTLVLDIQRRHGIPTSEVYNHWDLKATACPGVNLRDEIEEQQRVDLERRLRRAEKFLPRARGARLRRVQRFIRRLAALLGL